MNASSATGQAKGRFFFSIRYKVMAAMSALILILFPLTGYVAYMNGKSGVEAQIAQQTTGLALQTLDKINHHLALASYAVNLTNNLARSDVVRLKNGNEIIRFFQEMKRTYPQFQNFYFGDEEGNFWMVPQQKPEASILYDPRVRPWYQKAMRSENFCWTKVYIFSSTRRPGITAASMVRDNSGRTIGVVGIDIDLSSLSLFLKNMPIGKNGVAFILDSAGNYVAHPDMSLISTARKPDKVLSDAMDCLEGKKQMTGTIELNGRRFFAAHVPHLDKKWVVTVLVPYESFMGNIYNIRRSFAITFAAAILITILLGVYLTTYVTKPLTALVGLVKQVREGDLKGYIESSSNDEIGQLACQFNAMTEELSQRLFHLTTIHDLGKIVGEIFDLRNLLSQIVVNASHSMRSRRCSVAIWDQTQKRFSIKCAIGFKESEDHIVENMPLRGDSPILKKLRELCEPVIVNDITTDPRFSDIINMDIRLREPGQDLSFIAAPLMAHDKFLGVISVSEKMDSRPYNDEDLTLLVILSSQIVVAIDNANLYEELLLKARVDKELEIARNIQQRLLPPLPPSIPGLSISANYIPATEVSGDYYDFLAWDQDQLHMAVGDVSGKGIPASMMMVMLRSLLRYEASHGNLSLSEIMTKVNSLLLKDIDPSMFVTLVHAKLDLKTLNLNYVNAGHCYPCIIHEDGTISKLHSTGLLLGMFEQDDYAQENFQLKKGDILFMYSDGLEDLENEEEVKLGIEPVLNRIVQNRHLGAPTLSSEITALVNEYRCSARQFDDITYIILKIQ
ncbi:MAG: hypothetical protein CVV64_09480 [Candidatus Wallbacteria bacterium HGW-Wallbacteria-1]|jgi:sigma-B regulation protein RsbU (phosphoserine phosphatase)|uniref:HAMP domain-containing protein n=1 Tax=Candidatus Wallbacteria bacterium HGW-Wallbacteria-1 TaxID=2013854 RepID=A0A2N1PQH0_9BACT|nr:MAG: hypothetical protein CVV64_09480 [Candidatus Wallbacteria bacterium HGW-Wallbacteria-1]